MMENISQEVDDLNLLVVVSELNLVGLTLENGGSILMEPSMFTQTRICSLPSTQLIAGRSYSWGILLRPTSEVKEK